jgi:hypothetical protein
MLECLPISGADAVRQQIMKLVDFHSGLEATDLAASRERPVHLDNQTGLGSAESSLVANMIDIDL